MPDLGGEGRKIGMVEMPAKCCPASRVPSIPAGEAGSGATGAPGAGGKVMAKCALEVRSLLLCDWVGAGQCVGLSVLLLYFLSPDSPLRDLCMFNSTFLGSNNL